LTTRNLASWKVLKASTYPKNEKDTWVVHTQTQTIMALSSSQFVDRIDKLNGTNYRSWKFNMKMILVQRELWQHVIGEAILPADHTPQEEKHFNNKENKALKTIVLGVEPEHQIHIQYRRHSSQNRGQEYYN